MNCSFEVLQRRSGGCESEFVQSLEHRAASPAEHGRVVETAAVIDTAPLIAYLGGVRRALGRAARRVIRDAESGHVRLAVPTVCSSRWASSRSGAA